jgi:hypothetical protein
MSQEFVGPLTVTSPQGGQGGSLELGATVGVTPETPYVDFHFELGAAQQDFNVRLINTADNRLDVVTALGGTVVSIQGDKMGIGTLAPTQKLEVVGTVKATAFQGSGAELTGVRGTDATKVVKTGDTMSGALAITAAGTALRVTNNVAVGGTLTVGGNVGIGVAEPHAKLDVAGTIKGGGVLAGIWAAQPLTDVIISTSDTWQDVADTSVTFTLDRDAIVFFTYSINVQPNGNPGGDWLGTRLMIDGTPQRESGSHFQPPGHRPMQMPTCMAMWCGI